MYIFPGGRVANVWDDHAGFGIHGAKTGFDLLKSPVCIPPLDRGLSALIEDMSESGLLDTTLIAAAGEFGRTPKINPDGGRDTGERVSLPYWWAAEFVANRLREAVKLG